MSMPSFDSGAFTQEGQDRTTAQKKALMGVIAEQGAAGAQAYGESQAQVAATGQNALAGAAQRTKGSAVEGNADFASDNTNRMNAITSLYQADLNHGRESLGNDMSRLSASNSAYHDQISEAMPMVAQNIQGQFSAAAQRIAAEEKRREDERRMQEMQMQAQQEQLQAAREDRASRQANGGDNRTDDAKRMDALEIQGMEQKLAAGDPKANEAAAAEREKGAMRKASDVLGGVGTNGWAAFQDILNGTISVQDAKNKYHTPRGKSLSWDVIQNLVRDVNNARLS